MPFRIYSDRSFCHQLRSQLYQNIPVQLGNRSSLIQVNLSHRLQRTPSALAQFSQIQLHAGSYFRGVWHLISSNYQRGRISYLYSHALPRGCHTAPGQVSCDFWGDPTSGLFVAFLILVFLTCNLGISQAKEPKGISNTYYFERYLVSRPICWIMMVLKAPKDWSFHENSSSTHAPPPSWPWMY